MSADEPSRVDGLRERVRSDDGLVTLRRLALLMTLLLVFSFTFALYEVIDVVGEPNTFLLVVAGSLAAASILSRLLSVRVAVPVGVLLLAFGLYTYATALPADFVANQDRVIGDVVSLLNGLSVLRLQKIELWALGFTPAPVFLTWYFALRRHYVAAVVAGGAATTFFVLTGDMNTTVALLGAIGAVGAVGFGRLEEFGGSPAGGGDDGTPAAVEADGLVAQRRTVLMELGAIVGVSSTVSVVPGAGTQWLQPFGAGLANTVEASLIDADQRINIQGSIELSPKVRFTVSATAGDYWRVAAYDRYTGDGWVRTGSSRPLEGRLRGPPGRNERLVQRYEVQSTLRTIPAAWRPIDVEGDAEDIAAVTDIGGLQPQQGERLEEGDTYEIESRRPAAGPRELSQAGDDYPDELEDRFTQLPSSLPERVEERAERITGNASNPYEVARVVERWLENNRAYSLQVDKPDGDIADKFLFEMRRGYCTYYATTMTVMLRTLDIPARFVVGYTPGERVGNDRWVVRGLDSHAWVEVYFPDVGWVKFDPTPAGPRSSAERDRLEQARENGVENVDTDETDDLNTPTPDTPTLDTPEPGQTTRTPTPETPTPDTTTAPAVGGSNATITDQGSGGFDLELPSREEAALGAILVGGVVAGLRQTDATERAYRAVWVRWQPREEPAVDVERAFDRLEYVLARAERPRRPGETARQYLDAVGADERAHRVCDYYELSRYGGRVTEADADEAVRLVGEIVSDRLGPF
jgi:transglutaminase-like putative cysteine protease